MDPAEKKKLFFSHTYNFENSDGEEFLIRLNPWTQDLDKLPVHRLVFVSGSEPHVPIFRTRLHTAYPNLQATLSNVVHLGERVVYTKYNEQEVSVTRVVRSTFSDAESRASGSRGELASCMIAFGLEKIERRKKDKNQASTSKMLPKVGITIDKKPQNAAPREGDRRVDWAEDISKDNEAKVQEKKVNYLCDKLKGIVTKAITSSPVSVDPDDQSFIPISTNPDEINEILLKDLRRDALDEIAAGKFQINQVKTKDSAKTLVLNGTAMTSFQLYEGAVDLRLPTCMHTGVRFVLRSN